MNNPPHRHFSPTFPSHHPPTPSSESSLSAIETSYSSDTDYSLFASDTEFSTPSLTTASQASSSPPESPRYSDSPPFEGDTFILNADPDSDVDPPDSYFPCMTMSMRRPLSSFHVRQSA